MILNKLVTSSKLYVVLLIVATSLLLFIGSISFKQITEFRDSANWVTHTMEIEKEINSLFNIYYRMESNELKQLLRKDTLRNASSLKKYIADADSSINELKTLVGGNAVQQNHIKRISELQAELISSLKVISNAPQLRQKYSRGERNKIDNVADIMTQLNQRKNFMLNKQSELLNEREKTYKSLAIFTPYTILFLGFFALFIFVVSFLKINRELKSRSEAEAFLASVMANTENIVNYYEPVFDDNDEVKDFKLMYANDRNKIDFNLDPENIIGKNISEFLPFTKLNGEYEKIAQSYKEQKLITLNRQVQINGNKIWLDSNIRPLSKGILIVAKNNTFEKDSIDKLNNLNQELQVQYEELKNTEEFLQNVIKSTNNVVSYFEPIRDEQGKIIDFIVEYTNDELTNETGLKVNEVLNKKVSVIYPYLMENGVFEYLVECIENDCILEFERDYVFNNQVTWYSTYAIKNGDGVCVTSKNITKQKNNQQQLIDINDQLKIQNSILNDAKAIAKIGSYGWNVLNVNDESSTISDNLYMLLGCEPKAFEPTHENYKKFIHPEDLEYYESNIKTAVTNKETVDFSFRVITEARKVKHFRTTGSFQNDMLIGVAQDITSQNRNSLKLKEKNQALKRTNAELESFNRVASHDLQEPIRKIQMFISRIEETDLEKLSDRSKSYFEKISSSSERMRMLIKYLLSYSRINKTQKEFTRVDLTDIIQKVQEDLEARIKDENVTFVIDNLPTLKAIPFQMEQLFNNLLSNAIKYRGLEDPRIIIDCKKLRKSEISDNFVKKNKSYYRISVIDNGIGFEPEHAEKIFELFQRLHQKNEYSGTGIGLAICKKIVQNHSGHIVAESKPEKGSTFCIYLPA
ncbi:PAS domain-containing protein [Cellulophaga baltica]|uniref:ATP-binding protein n=1 Tax=Cellulophaga TaxID=104264 RepID=UPI001C0748F0|nr:MULTISPECIES: ATP-binding protein [Cellulophaga]MBU2997718.1 PAS domain-containing protein [Cellulophaga baltica]MDO6769113.1 ATP-binding protein [Cellulophaga sp. 1_MG-2023]